MPYVLLILYCVCVVAPVSKPVVSQMCFSPEHAMITCFSRGDEVEFSLTLNDLLLVQTVGHSQCQRNWASNVQPLSFSDIQDNNNRINFILDIHRQPTGHLLCRVWNNISQDETVIQLTGCKGTVFEGCFLSFLNIISPHSPIFRGLLS